MTGKDEVFQKYLRLAGDDPERLTHKRMDIYTWGERIMPIIAVLLIGLKSFDLRWFGWSNCKTHSWFLVGWWRGFSEAGDKDLGIYSGHEEQTFPSSFYRDLFKDSNDIWSRNFCCALHGFLGLKFCWKIFRSVANILIFVFLLMIWQGKVYFCQYDSNCGIYFLIINMDVWVSFVHISIRLISRVLKLTTM